MTFLFKQLNVFLIWGKEVFTLFVNSLEKLSKDTGGIFYLPAIIVPTSQALTKQL